MNCNVYIFGELSSGYTQYPEDSSSYVLKKIYPLCKAPTQIAIHRDTNMMYYCYVRKLNGNKYLGLCIAVNGYYISRVDELFSLFENTIEKIAQQGSFINFAKDGTLTTSTTVLKQEEEEIDTLSENLRRGFESIGSSTNTLPQVDYTVAKDSVKEFNALDDKRDIVRASYTYGYTLIYKDKDFNTVRVNSYRSILSQLNEENNNLRKRNEELKEQNTKILRQKKQFRNVVFLILAIIACGIGLLSLNNHLDITKKELADANHTISIKNDTIKRRDYQIVHLHQDVHNLNQNLKQEREKYYQVKNKYESLKSLLNDIQPFIVERTSFNFNTGWFTFYYYGFRDTTVTIQVKALGDYTYRNSSRIDIEKGFHSNSIYLDRRLNSSNWYSFELLIGDKIVGGDRH